MGAATRAGWGRATVTPRFGGSAGHHVISQIDHLKPKKKKVTAAPAFSPHSLDVIPKSASTYFKSSFSCQTLNDFGSLFAMLSLGNRETNGLK